MKKLALLAGIVSLGVAGYVVAAESSSGSPSSEKSPRTDADPGSSSGPPTPAKRPSLSELARRHQGDAPNEAECQCLDDPELSLLAALRHRREELDARAALLAERESILTRLEHDLEARVATALGTVAELEERLELGEAQHQAQQEEMNRLVETLGGLSARRAAPMLAQSHPNFAVAILNRLGPEKAGALLAKLDPEQAAALLQAMAPKAAARATNKGRSRGNKRGGGR